MNGKINIRFEGGAASIGNVVQGDHNTVSSGNATTRIEDAFNSFQARLSGLAQPFDRPAAEIALLERQIEALKEKATASAPDVEGGIGILKTIRDNFIWVWPAVKDLVAVAWPAVLAAFAG